MVKKMDQMKAEYEAAISTLKQTSEEEKRTIVHRGERLEHTLNQLGENLEKKKRKIKELKEHLASRDAHPRVSMDHPTPSSIPTSTVMDTATSGVVTDAGYFVLRQPTTTTTTTTETMMNATTLNTDPKSFVVGGGQNPGQRTDRLIQMAQGGDGTSYDTEVDSEDYSEDSYGHSMLKSKKSGFGHGYQGKSRRGGRRDPQKDRLMKISSASKVLKIKLNSDLAIIDFLDCSARLEDQLNDLYGTDDEKLKIQLALNQCDDKVRQDAESVYEKCRTLGHFNLSEFFKDLFKLMYPAPFSSMDITFRTLSQNSPTKSTIVEYGRKFRTICKLLRYDVQAHISKFVEGLATEALKAALRRTSTEGMNFMELVSLAVSIENNLTFEKPSASKMFVGQDSLASSRIFVGQESSTGSEILGLGPQSYVEWDGEEYPVEKESVLAIFGIPISKYFKEAEKKSVTGKCFNCMDTRHNAGKCTVKYCKFCKKEVKLAKHYSLLCPLAPKHFGGLLKARQAAVQNYKAKDKVKFASEFSGYEFSSDELSGAE